MSDPAAARATRASRQAAALEKERQTLELRRAGMTFPAIAATLGYAGGARSAQRTYERALARTLMPAATEARRTELDSLGRLKYEAWTIATDPNQDVLNRLRAIDVLIRLSKRVSALLGLDAPVRVDHRVTDSVMAEIQQLADEIERDAGGAPVPREAP